MHTPENAQALLALIAEQQTTIIALRSEIETLEKKSNQYRDWWLEEQETVKTLTDAASK